MSSRPARVRSNLELSESQYCSSKRKSGAGAKTHSLWVSWVSLANWRREIEHKSTKALFTLMHFRFKTTLSNEKDPYLGIFTAFHKWSPTTLHNRKHVTWPFMQVDPYYLDAGCISVLWAVGCGFYRYISMGTTMSMLLLFTRSSRIHRENVDSQAIDIYTYL